MEDDKRLTDTERQEVARALLVRHELETSEHFDVKKSMNFFGLADKLGVHDEFCRLLSERRATNFKEFKTNKYDLGFIQYSNIWKKFCHKEPKVLKNDGDCASFFNGVEAINSVLTPARIKNAAFMSVVFISKNGRCISRLRRGEDDVALFLIKLRMINEHHVDVSIVYDGTDRYAWVYDFLTDVSFAVTTKGTCAGDLELTLVDKEVVDCLMSFVVRNLDDTKEKT